MPQLPAKPDEAKKLIDASMPKNISAEARAKLEAAWTESARIRNAAIAREVAVPAKPSLILKYEIHKFGHHWNSFAVDKKGKRVPLMPAPSLFTSACDAITDQILEDVTKA